MLGHGSELVVEVTLGHGNKMGNAFGLLLLEVKLSHNRIIMPFDEILKILKRC